MRNSQTIQKNHQLTTTLATLSIFFINVVFFIVLNVAPETRNILLIDASTTMILQKPWTLVTVFFSHEVWFHLLGNMSLLLYFGLHLEKRIGSKRMLLVYLVSGFISTLTIPMLAPIIQFSGLVVGASGACFGVVAAFATISPRHQFSNKESRFAKMMFAGDVRVFAILLFAFNAVVLIINPAISIGAGAHSMGMLVGVLFGLQFKKNLVEQV